MSAGLLRAVNLGPDKQVLGSTLHRAPGLHTTSLPRGKRYTTLSERTHSAPLYLPLLPPPTCVYTKLEDAELALHRLSLLRLRKLNNCRQANGRGIQQAS